uniref:ribonuclease H n=1 Tax=Amazona collaria TaxID=241587 RepID=A0A8B9FRL6_9PSIT
MAFPVVADNGGYAWEALDWKILKEAKSAISQYGLKSPYSQSLLQHIFSSHLFTPYNSRMVAQMLLSPSQQLHFYQNWQTACDGAAAIPRQQGDPLCGVQAQMLMGAGPFVRLDLQVQFAHEVLQLSQDLAFKALLSIPDDKVRPAFTSVPATNKQEPAKRYQWVVLPQGMKNSPTLCQTFVAWALQPFRQTHQSLLVYHYMDDILIAGEKLDVTEILQELQQTLGSKNLHIAPEKVQRQCPWQYLGWTITGSTVRPQKIKLHTEINTLTDAQKLMGNIQWVRSIAGITNDDLAPLMSLLGTSVNANSRRQLTPEQKLALEKVTDKILTATVQRQITGLPLRLLIVNSSAQRKHLLGLIIQQNDNDLKILEWIFLSFQPKNTICTRIELFANMIIKGRKRIIDMAGREPDVIYIPIVQDYLNWLLTTSETFQIALAEYPGTLSNTYPPTKFLPILQDQTFEEIPVRSETPVEGLTVFTDAGRKSKRAAATWYTDSQWKHHILQGHLGDSLQTLELRAVLWVFPAMARNTVKHCVRFSLCCWDSARP